MIAHADDSGMIRADPAYIRGIAWPQGVVRKGPLGECRGAGVELVRAWLGVAVERGMVRHVVGEELVRARHGAGDSINYYYITNFKKYNPSPSRQDGKDGKDGKERKEGVTPHESFKERDLRIQKEREAKEHNALLEAFKQQVNKEKENGP